MIDKTDKNSDDSDVAMGFEKHKKQWQSQGTSILSQMLWLLNLLESVDQGRGGKKDMESVIDKQSF